MIVILNKNDVNASQIDCQICPRSINLRLWEHYSVDWNRNKLCMWLFDSVWYRNRYQLLSPKSGNKIYSCKTKKLTLSGVSSTYTLCALVWVFLLGWARLFFVFWWMTIIITTTNTTTDILMITHAGYDHYISLSIAGRTSAISVQPSSATKRCSPGIWTRTSSSRCTNAHFAIVCSSASPV